MRRELAAAAFRLTAGYDALISEELSRRWWARRPTFSEEQRRRRRPARSCRRRSRSSSSGCSRCATARTRIRRPRSTACSGADVAPGAFSSGALVVQGKPLSYNNILDASAAAGLARDLRGAACVIIKHANPCGAAEAARSDRGLGAGPGRRSGQRLRRRRRADRSPSTRHWPISSCASSSRWSSRRPSTPDALEILARRPNMRVVLDPSAGRAAAAGTRAAQRRRRAPRHGRGRRRGRSCERGRVATQRAADGRRARRARLCLARVPPRQVECHRPGAWPRARRRGRRTDEPRRQRPPRGGQSRAGAGARRRVRLGRVLPVPGRGSRCVSRPVSLPSSSPAARQRDAEVIAAVDAAGGAMLLTGTRHFRH